VTRTCAQNTALWREIERMHLICDDKIAVKFRALEEHYFVLRMQRGRIAASAAASAASTGTQFSHKSTCFAGTQVQILTLEHAHGPSDVLVLRPAFEEVAVERYSSIFTELTAMLRGSGSKQEYLDTQHMMATLRIHLEACALLSLPVGSQLKIRRRCSLALLVQTCVFIGTKVQILTPEEHQRRGFEICWSVECNLQISCGTLRRFRRQG
jgi:hypothetical protein